MKRLLMASDDDDVRGGERKADTLELKKLKDGNNNSQVVVTAKSVTRRDDCMFACFIRADDDMIAS